MVGIISLSPDRRRSTLYAVTLSYDNTPMMITSIRTAGKGLNS